MMLPPKSSKADAEATPSRRHFIEPSRRRGAGYILWVAFLLLLVTAASLAFTVLIAAKGVASINRLATLRLDTEVLLTDLKDVETGVRGFLVTTNPVFLDPYNDARPRIEARLDRVAAEIAGAASGLSLGPLRELTQRKLALSDAAVRLGRDGLITEARSAVSESEGKRVMDAIRGEIQRLSTSVDQRRADVEEQTYNRSSWAAAATLMTAVSASILVGLTALVQRRQSGEQLRLAEESRTLALDASGLATWTWKVRSDVLEACPSMRRLFGLPETSPLSSNDLFKAVVDQDRQSLETCFRNADSEGGCEWEGWVGNCEARVRLVHLRAGLYRDGAGVPTALRGVVQDITARHASEQRVRDMQAELAHASRISTVGETASATAHELSQPLSAAATFFQSCDMVIRSGQPYDRDDLLSDLSRGLSALGRAADIVRNFRRFLRKEALNRERLDLNNVVRDAVEMGAIGFERKEAGRIVWALTPGMTTIEGDRTQVQQVVVNLVRNAVDAMAGRAVRELRVGTLNVGERVQLSVSDTGPGLHPSVEQEPFRPFSTTKPAGLGLGLSVSKTIVEAHGGLISVASTPAGATFTVDFPAAAERRDAA